LLHNASPETDQQGTTLLAALGLTPTGPAAGSTAAWLMTYFGGQTGIQAGTAYAVA